MQKILVSGRIYLKVAYSSLFLSTLVQIYHTANMLTVLSTAFVSITCATAIWLYILQPEMAIDLKLYSSVSSNVICTIVDCNNHCQITVAQVTQPMNTNWL